MINIIKNFNKTKILVIGDLMLDTWIQGHVNRISPEADVPVVLGENTIYAPGGAGNCAANIKSLGGKAAVLGIVGQDQAGQELKEIFKQIGITISGLFRQPLKPTTQKIRISGIHNQITRLDWENTQDINQQTQDRILMFFKKNVLKYQAVILSDYAKGLFAKALTKKIIQITNQKKIPTIADIKPKNMEKFIGVSVVMPNLTEAVEMSGLDSLESNNNRATEKMAKIIKQNLQSNVIITRGAKGMTVFNGKLTHIPTQAREIYEVAGAGDTAVSALALSIASGASLKNSAKIANTAAGIAVSKHGTTAVTQDELIKNINAK
ncbi:D-glycero-beta-D-manno-heptose-7-phosphate kinase [bacterium]|nr:D-glycero-beta-D-manno-heptose-7-phosphate kinase [bacterium]|tara:strand:- start:2598 stop:3563 length:966 start_codon:yes stop_codon:yes gene_type:complete